NNLGISIQQGLNLSVEEPPQENEATKNVIANINTIVSRLEALPTIDELIDGLSVEVAKRNEKIDKEKLVSALHALTQKWRLEDFTYGKIKQNFIDKIVESTPFNHHQVLDLIDSTKNY